MAIFDDCSIQDIDIVVFDCEATGLHCETSEIIEIGAVRMRGGVTTGVFSCLLKSSIPLSPRIQKLTGISQREIDAALPTEFGLELFRQFASGAQAWGGYFITLDMGYMASAYSREARGRTFESAHGARPVLCAKSLARLLQPDLPPDFDLAFLVEHLGLRLSASHRALNDAQSTAAVLELFFERAMKRGIKTIRELLEYQIEPVASPWAIPSRDPEQIKRNREAEKRWVDFVKSTLGNSEI